MLTRNNKLRSSDVPIAPSIGAQKLGQPVPLSNLVPEENSEQDAIRFFLGRLSELSPKAKQKLNPAEGKRLDCLLQALSEGRRDATGC